MKLIKSDSRIERPYWIKNRIKQAKRTMLLVLMLIVLVYGFASPNYGRGHQISHRAAMQPTTNTGWTFTGSHNTARYGHTATLLKDGKVLVAGARSDPSA
jgi:hypothetical protein